MHPHKTDVKEVCVLLISKTSFFAKLIVSTMSQDSHVSLSLIFEVPRDEDAETHKFHDKVQGRHQ